MIRSITLSILLILTGCATLPEHYVSMDSESQIKLEELFEDIKNNRVIFIGERHDRMEDHLFQFEIVKRLYENHVDIVIALEMFPSEMQAVLDGWVEGAYSDNGFKQAYQMAWGMPYEYYETVFNYARKVRIPLVGINGNQVQIENVAKNGLKTLPEEFRRAIGVTTCAESPSYEIIIGHFGQQHTPKLPFFCDAQLLRDTIMANNIARIMKTGKQNVVVLVGSLHAIKVAIPSILERSEHVSYKVLLSKEAAEVLFDKPDGRIADYLWY